MPEEISTSKVALDISDLMASLDAMKREIASANATFKKETAGMDSWSKDADGLSAKLKQLDSVLKAQTRIIDNYRQQIEAHAKKQKEAQEAVEKHKAELQKLKDEGLDENSKAYKDEVAQLEKAIKAERDEATAIQNLKSKIEQQEASVATTQASIEKYTQAQKDLVKQNASLENTIKSQEKQLRDLKKEYAETAAKEGESSDAAKALSRQIESLSGELNDNRAAMEKAAKAADGFDRTLESVEKQVEETTEETEKQSGIFARSLDNFVGGAMLQLATAAWNKFKEAVSASINFMKDSVVAGAEYADNILTMASTTGIGTDALQEFAFMEDRVDVSTGTIASSMKKLKAQISSAAKENKTATAAFEKLGISIYDANGNLRDSEEIYYEAIEALSGIQNETERDAAAMDVFGKSATDLNPLLEAGAEKLEALRKEARDTGAVLSGSALAALGAAQDGMDRLSKSVDTAKNRFAQNLAPAVEAATGKLNDALNNPRTQLALDNLSASIGDSLSKGADLISNILPGILSFFSADVRVKSYTDAQLELYNGFVDAKRAHEELREEFSNNAQDILDEKDRVEDLWGQLQDLVTETGHVTSTNKDLAKVLLDELNKELGTEYKLTGNLISDYQKMQKEIGNLIQKKTAMALIEAGTEQYTQNVKDQGKALSDAANFAADLEQAEKDLAAAIEERDRQQEIANSRFDDTEDGITKSLRYMKQYDDAVYEQEALVKQLRSDYAGAQDEYYKLQEEIDRYHRAQTAAAQDSYDQVIDIMANETNATIDHFKNKEALAEADREELRKIRDQQERDIIEYEKGLSEGRANFSNRELEKLKKQLELTNAILEGDRDEIDRITRELGHAFDDGLAEGIKSRRYVVADAARGAMNQAINAARAVAMIASPSKVMEEMGEFLDLGLAKGMKAKLTTVERASEQMMRAAIPDRQSVSASGAAGGTVNSFTQIINAPKTPSRLELYRDAENLLAMGGLA